jgi:hypothetical protein
MKGQQSIFLSHSVFLYLVKRGVARFRGVLFLTSRKGRVPIHKCRVISRTIGNLRKVSNG